MVEVSSSLLYFRADVGGIPQDSADVGLFSFVNLPS